MDGDQWWSLFTSNEATFSSVVTPVTDSPPLLEGHDPFLSSSSGHVTQPPVSTGPIYAVQNNYYPESQSTATSVSSVFSVVELLTRIML